MKRPIMKQKLSLISRCAIALAASQLFICAAWADDSAAIADLKAKLAAVERNVEQLAESKSKPTAYAGIPLHGFADVGYTRASNDQTRIDQAGRGFAAGTLDFYLTPQFGDRTKALIELIFEFASDNSLATDLERLQFGYTFSDELTTWIGRFHAPYGYWNTGFHHGAEIQTSILRPRFIDFEDKGGLLPAHVVGAWATGSTHVRDARLTYDLYVGNGNAINVDTSILPPFGPSHTGSLSITNSRDSNGNHLIGLNVGYNIGDMIIGAHALTERVSINDANTPPTISGEVGVHMTGLYAFYEGNDWENIAEYYSFKNKDLTTAAETSYSSWLGFAQVGRIIGDWTPYVRVEKGSVDQMDPYFNTQEYGVSYSRQALGAKYALNANAALKLEANQTKEGDGIATSGAQNGNYKEVRFQYSIRF